jgi:hypothetical protein
MYQNAFYTDEDFLRQAHSACPPCEIRTTTEGGYTFNKFTNSFIGNVSFE